MADDCNKLPGLDAREVAALATLRGLSFGAAHSLNNAFSSAIGEASYLLEERKDDAELVECCQLILEALERSTRLTRALLARRNAASDDETDLGRLARELVPLLRETLGSGHPLSLECDDDWIGVKAESVEIDLALTALFQYAAEASGERAALAGKLEKLGESVRLTVEVGAACSPDAAARAVNDPELAADPIARACLVAARDIVQRAGGSLHAEGAAPDAWAFAIVLPAL